METTFADHLLALLLMVALPLYAHHEFGRMRRRLAAGDRGARRREYGWTIALQWALVAALLGLWAWRGRPWELLGISGAEGRFLWLGLALAAVVVVVLLAQVVQLRGRPEAREEVESQLGDVGDILPRTPGEMRGFAAVSLTAGICEELLFRGFLIAWLVSLSGLGEWPAMLLIAVAFGVAHFYQGAAGVLKTGLAGAFLGALYLLTGSLLVPVVVHALIDLLQGYAAYQVLREEAPVEAGVSPAQS